MIAAKEIRSLFPKKLEIQREAFHAKVEWMGG
jgi:hypothetical protein